MKRLITLCCSCLLSLMPVFILLLFSSNIYAGQQVVTVCDPNCRQVVIITTDDSDTNITSPVIVENL